MNRATRILVALVASFTVSLGVVATAAAPANADTSWGYRGTR